MKITHLPSQSTDPTHPLYHHFDGQLFPQPAYLEIDLDAKSLRAGWSEEIGGAVPMRVWEGEVLRFRINPDLTCEEVNILIDDAAPLVQRVIEYAERRVLGAFSDNLLNDIERMCSERFTEGGGVVSASDFFQSKNVLPRPDMTDDEIQEFADNIEWENDATVVGIVEYLKDQRDAKQS